MRFLARHPFSVALCAVAIAATAGFPLVEQRHFGPPQPQGHVIPIPHEPPAADRAGAAGWVWPDGVPGWAPGQTIQGYPISGIQAVEAQPLQLSAAHDDLFADGVRVLDAMHVAQRSGPLAIFAAPAYESTSTTACLAAALPSATSFTWRCPDDLAGSRVLVAAVRRGDAVWLVGVARGDVDRVVLRVPGQTKLATRPIYERGTTWGEFDAAYTAPPPAGPPELEIGSHGRLVETLTLALPSGGERIFR